MKQGFALIELIVSIAISSIMGTVLFTLIFQMQKSEQSVAEMVSVGIQSAIIQERLQKDLGGICWPKFIPELPEKAQKKIDQKDQKNLKALEKSTEFEKIKIGPKIAKILYSQNTRNDELEMLQECSFLTSNPLQVYNEAKPKMVRVIYKLIAEQGYPNSFALYRQESIDLDYKQALNDASSFILAEGIKSLNLTYFYQDTDEEQSLTKYQELEFGQGDDEASEDPRSKEELVPKYIQVNLALWQDAQHQDYQEFEFWFTTYASSKKVAKEEKKDESK